jgi:hypothetical protein
MFGGLEVKGSAKGNGKEDAPAPAASAASGFSFLSPSASPPAPVPSSVFSFLNSGAAPPAPAETPAPAASSGSVFDFMGTAADSAATPVAAPAPSTFNFLSESTTATTTTTTGPPAAENPPSSEAPAAAPSSFSFLSSSSPLPPTTEAPGSGEHAAAPSMTQQPATDLLSTAPAPAAAGSGVVFGGAAAAVKPKKRRTRTHMIGAGAQPPTASTASSSAQPPPLPASTPTARPPLPEPKDSRAGAVEASQRAETFMNEKLAEQKSHDSMESTPPLSLALKLSHDDADRRSSPPPALQTAPSLDRDDEEVAQAMAAAEEAHRLAAGANKQRSGGAFGLGGLFRSGNQRTVSASSVTSQKNATEHRPTAASTEASTVKEESPVERLQREQNQVKRAMAERQLQMMKEQANAEKVDNTMEKDSSSLEMPTYGEARESSSTQSKTSLEIPSYGEAKPIAVIPVPLPPQQKASRASPAASFPAPSTAQDPPKLTMKSTFSFRQAKPVPPPVVRKPVPVKMDTATDVYVGMMRVFTDKIATSMAEIQRLRQHKSGLLEERFKTVAKERLAVQQKASAEAQQMAAAEAEDFELADRLGTLLESHERDQAECAAILENIGRALSQLDSQKKAFVDRMTGYFSDIQRKLQLMQQEEESKETEDVAEKLNMFSHVSKQLSVENERLEQDWKHLERDAELVAQEREEVERTISEQAGVYEKLRDEAREKVTKLEEEIEALRKQLADKQGQVARLRTDAAGHDETVLKVRVKFSRQLARVQKKEMTIQDNREEWDNEKRAYDDQKEEHEVEVTAHSEALLARDKLLETLKTEIEMADTFEAIIGKEVGFEVSGSEESPDDELADLQAEVVKCEASLTEFKEVLHAAVNAVATLETEASDLEARIPMLEETKKTAASKRDFKTAGRASKEIKEATARLQECQSEITGSAADKKADAHEQCNQLEEELTAKRQVALEKEKDAGKVTMERLADHMKRLLATKESVCANASDDSIQAVGALVLEAQIEALRFEGRTYGEKYGGWDELVADLGLSQDERSETEAPGDVLDATTPTEETVATEDEVLVDTVPMSTEEKLLAMSEFRELTVKIEEMNVGLEEAAEEEDYEKAGEIQEELDGVLERINSLGLDDEEMAAALASPSDIAIPDSDEPPAEALEEIQVTETEETPEPSGDSQETEIEDTLELPEEVHDVVEESNEPNMEGQPETGETLDEESGSEIVAEVESGEADESGASVLENGTADMDAVTSDKEVHVNGEEEEAAAPVLSEDNDL